MPEAPTMRLAVFASGSGSNLQAILDAVDAGTLNAEVVLVVTDRPGIGALDRAARHGTPTFTLAPADCADTEAFGQAILDALRAHDVTFIALAGYLKMIPEVVVHAYRHRIVNIHPALLPAFGGPGMYGRRVHAAAIEHGVRWSGATVHLVDEAYDTGPIVAQQPVPVEPGDTPETLAARVLAVEHTLYPEALRMFADGRVRIVGRTVTVLPDSRPPDSVAS